MESNNDQYDILAKMTPEQRLKAFLELCRSARRIKEAALRQFNPNWPDDKILAALRESFLHARS
jgi:hypothetical protein